MFAAKWSVYDGGERSEAQTFLNELFDCYGTDRQTVARFEQRQGVTFVDAIWPRVCLIEMKAPSETSKLATHRKQVLDYWVEAADPATNTPSPRWVVLCSFRRLEIWEPGAFPKEPRLVLDLIDLPDQYDALLFLAGDEPVFAGGQAELTREAVVHVVDLYEQLQSRAAADDDVLRDFLLQTVWCLFAEDLAQIPGHRFTTIVDDLIASPKRSSADDLFGLFEALNAPGTEHHGLYAGGFAVALARVTLWMGHTLAVRELDLDESTLPLADLSGIRVGDALKRDWPRADAIIGNPPFHGDRNLRGLLGDDYIEWLKKEFGVGVKDYCVYWFRKAHDHLAPDGRAGLVGTNSISQNRARGASLEYVVDHGGVITSAVSSQDWPGEAAVDVSIVNWIKGDDPRRPVLDGEEVERIGASLRADQGHAAKKLPPNRGIAFQGMLPGANYIVGLDAAEQLRSVASPAYSDVVRPYLTGDDIANHPAQAPSRFIVDFGTRRLEEAMCYPEAVEIVRAQAKDDREQSRSYSRNPRWWQFLWPRPVFRERTKTLRRFIAGTATGKRILFCWCASDVVASNATNVFALEKDLDFGILMSRIHTGWAEARSSTLEDRIRYTPSSAFETFPWPTANVPSIGDVAGRLLALRAEICGAQEIGLTKLYNQMDDGAWKDLRDLHRELDEAVAAAYGWPKSVAHDPDESNRRLLELNRAIAAGEVEYDPFRER